MGEDTLVAVGHVVRPWGRRGAVIVELALDDPEELVGTVVVKPRGAASAEMTVVAARAHGDGRAVVEFEGVETIEKAETLRDAALLRAAGASGPAPEGRFYARELIGLRVVRASGEEIGRVAEIRETGGADLLVVRGAEREHLIPFARSICVDIEPAAGRIVVDPPDGLLELP